MNCFKIAKSSFKWHFYLLLNKENKVYVKEKDILTNNESKLNSKT